jgi:hypothetical protein
MEHDPSRKPAQPAAIKPLYEHRNQVQSSLHSQLTSSSRGNHEHNARVTLTPSVNPRLLPQLDSSPIHVPIHTHQPSSPNRKHHNSVPGHY